MEILRKKTQSWLEGVFSLEEIITPIAPEHHLTTGAFCLIFSPDNCVLFTKSESTHKHPYEIPGGHIEPGETIEECMKREVFEETGVSDFEYVQVGVIKYTRPELSQNDHQYPVPVSYLVLYAGITREKYSPNEDGIWFTLEEAREQAWTIENRAMFESLYQEAKYVRGDFERSYLDVYDQTGVKIIDTKTYDEVHRQGLWHKGVHVWVLTPDGKFIIQKRGPYVQTKPNILEASAGGHVNSGNTAIQAVIEECHEEIGVVVQESDIEYVATIVDQFEEMEGAIKNNEFDDIYLIRKAVKPEDVVMGKKEVSEVLFYDAKEYLIRGIEEDSSIAYRPEEYKILYKHIYGKDYTSHN